MSRRVVLIVGLIILAIVCVGIALTVRGQQQVAPSPSPPPPTATNMPGQETLYLAVRADSGVVANAVALGVPSQSADAAAASPAASWLSIQPGLAVGVAAARQTTVADTGPLEPAAAVQTVANQLGVTLDDALVLDRLAFAALVDAVNGVTVDVSTPFRVVSPDGTARVLVRRGTRNLDGPTAATYVTVLPAGELQAERMERFDDVLRQVVVKLPPTVDATRRILGSLGSLGRSSGSPTAIAEVLLSTRRAILGDSVTMAAVPATRHRDGSQTVYNLIPDQEFELVSDLFGPSLIVPTPDQGIRVRVYAAGVTYDVVEVAAAELADINQQMVWGGNRKAEQRSQILVVSKRWREAGLDAASALGLPESTVRVDADGSVGVPITITLGGDAAPAVDPATGRPSTPSIQGT